MSQDAFKSGDDWSYSGETGPEHWHEIAPICASGVRQSPIDLDGFETADLAPLICMYDVPAQHVDNNGHCIRIFFAAGAAIEVGERRFALDHLHFHVPSEHHIEGKSFAMEAHFVHRDKAGAVAVVAVFYENGRSSRALEKIAQPLPAGKGKARDLDSRLNAAEFLPDNLDYYYYPGSLTTPPATEGVNWYLLKRPLGVSTDEANEVLHAHGGPNNRPLQARNGRKVLA